MLLIKIRKELGNVFSLNDVSKLLDKDKNYLSIYLNKHLKKGNIYQIRSGWYSFDRVQDKFLVAKTFKGAYVSLNSAIEFYGFSTQKYIKLELISLNQKKQQTILDWSVDFTKIKKQYFFGYKKEMYRGEEILIADREKLLIDCLLNQRKVSLEEIKEYLNHVINDLNMARLKDYLDEMNLYALNKRIGFLLEKHGINLELKINSKYDVLDINKSKFGNKNKLWKIIEND